MPIEDGKIDGNLALLGGSKINSSLTVLKTKRRSMVPL